MVGQIAIEVVRAQALIAEHDVSDDESGPEDA